MFALRRPEYTGKNRCLPCTVVNLLIALITANLLFVLIAVVRAPMTGAIAAVAFLAASIALIWTRGYLVPGTPTLTKRYLPRRVLGWFGKGERGPLPAEDAELDVILEDAGILEPCATRDDLCLTDDFAAELDEALEVVDVDLDAERLVRELGVRTGEITIQHEGDAQVVYADEQKIGEWPSEVALLVDIAIGELLPDRLSSWDQLSPERRAQLLFGVRLFLEDCPDDGGPVELREETVKSCCSEHEVVEAVCADSGARLFEQTVY